MANNRRIGGKRLQHGGMILLGAVIIGLLIALGVYFWNTGSDYSSYNIIKERSQDDTLSYSYCAFSGKVLQYGADGAMLLEDDETVIWETDYMMSLPKVTIGSRYGAVYDKNGMNVVVFDREKTVGTFSTRVPIVKMTVSETGTVAAILDDGNNTWIRYYKSSGEEISAILTKIDQQGYPMDIALSPNGEILEVSYLAYNAGVQESRVYFYNFAQTGDNQEDNLVSSYEYSGNIVPELMFIDDDTSAAFTSNGFVIYEGSQRPEKKKEITVKNNIVSVFHNEKYLGLVLERNSEKKPFTLQVYDQSGNAVLDQDISFMYDHIEIMNDQITLYLNEHFCVYNVRGKKRFEGSYKQKPQAFFAVKNGEYTVVTDDGIRWIELK